MTINIKRVTEPLSPKEAGVIEEMYRARSRDLKATSTLEGQVLNAALKRPDIALFCAYDGKSLVGVSLLEQLRAQYLLLFAYTIRMRDTKDPKFRGQYHYQALLATRNMMLENPELYTDTQEFLDVNNDEIKRKKKHSSDKGRIGLYRNPKRWPLVSTPMRATSTDYMKIFTAVLPDHQGKGIGTLLNRETLAYSVHETEAENIFTTCPESDKRMQRINILLGYEPLAKCSPFYKDGTPAVIMGVRVEDFRRGIVSVPTRERLEELLKK